MNVRSSASRLLVRLVFCGRGRTSYVKVWSAALRVEDMPQEEQGKDTAEMKARAAFGACVCAINAVNSVLYRFAAASKVRAQRGAKQEGPSSRLGASGVQWVSLLYKPVLQGCQLRASVPIRLRPRRCNT